MTLAQSATENHWWTTGLAESVSGTRREPPGSFERPTVKAGNALPEQTPAWQVKAIPGHSDLNLEWAPKKVCSSFPPISEVLTVLRRLCLPLAYLHGEGLVHRDLKPVNVLVRPNGWPVLVDFGLLSRFTNKLSREVLELGGQIVGSIPYMSPEQIRGELVDARADLYSLGCMLFRLLTGRPPFDAPEVNRQLLMHLYQEPPTLSSLRSETPPELEELVGRLLAKKRKDRLGYADSVARALEELGAEPLVSKDPTPAKTYLYRPEFAGRSQTLDSLEQFIGSRFEARQGGVILLGGESGIGKTSLAMELGRKAVARKARVLLGECLPGHSQPLQPLLPALEAVADHCQHFGKEEAERLLGARGPVLAVYQSSLGGLPGLKRYPQPAKLPARAARLRLFAALTETLAAMAVDTATVEATPVAPVALVVAVPAGASVAGAAAQGAAVPVGIPLFSSSCS